MKRAMIFLAFIIFAACAMPKAESQKVEGNQNASPNPQSAIQNPKSNQLVLVELFTSEG